MENNKYRVGLLTPIDHLPKFKKILNTYINNGLYVLNLNYATDSGVHALRFKLQVQKINIIFCNPNAQPFIIGADLLDGSHVSHILTASTGTNHIDMAYCEKNGIEVHSLKDDRWLLKHLPSTSELAFGLLLDLLRNITASNNYTKESNVWNYVPFVGNMLNMYHVGVVGYGRLGRMMVKYLEAFGAIVHIYDPYYPKSTEDSLEELFDVSDAVSLHVHATPDTHNMINADLLTNHPINYLVNTSRGHVVDEHAVVDALERGHLHGYATDVIKNEFESDISKSPLLQNPDLKIIITPHIGGMTIEGQELAYKATLNKLFSL